ncbi:MAG TPA: PAS domain S-box protein [Methanolinea sp.]|nr:PAS domain S-box protein [Methanolinea sp.]HPC56199.1 PAS domain S-box protein [Methanolinea sp.]HQE86534.1 PAS domain S-box protein [Methanolinea sp.]HRU80720.1 PAS domain S-box protein [Methanolinea sp.]
MDREELQAIFEKIQTGVAIIDPSTHTILDINPIAVSLIGRRKDEIVGQVCHQFICPAERGKCPITDLKQVIDNSERVIIAGDGTRIPILKTATRARVGERDVLIESFIDIRDRKVAEDRRCALIGYIGEIVMRIRQPLVIVQQNLADLAEKTLKGQGNNDEVRAGLLLEAARIRQIAGNLAEVERAIAEEREDIPAAYREFLKGQ